MTGRRFIDHSSDGGCSKKASCSQLRALLNDVGQQASSKAILTLSIDMPDTGAFTLPSVKCLSTVDIILPMIDDPEHFGRIAANHSLNDIYAGFGRPHFALAIVGVSSSLEPNSPEVTGMLAAAAVELKNAGVALIGGHTLSNQGDLYLGFAIVGTEAASGNTLSVEPGDSIFLTKRLGTSVASVRWKAQLAGAKEHDDVVSGMLSSNRRASEVAAQCGVRYCTDVSGFGLLNNLASIVQRCSGRARLNLDRLPSYESVEAFLGQDEFVTRQYYYNAEAALAALGLDSFSKLRRRALWLDSQVSGGLLFVCPASQEERLTQSMASEEILVTKIGVLEGGPGPLIELIEEGEL